MIAGEVGLGVESAGGTACGVELGDWRKVGIGVSVDRRGLGDVVVPCRAINPSPIKVNKTTATNKLCLLDIWLLVICLIAIRGMRTEVGEEL